MLLGRPDERKAAQPTQTDRHSPEQVSSTANPRLSRREPEPRRHAGSTNCFEPDVPHLSVTIELELPGSPGCALHRRRGAHGSLGTIDGDSLFADAAAGRPAHRTVCPRAKSCAKSPKPPSDSPFTRPHRFPSPSSDPHRLRVVPRRRHTTHRPLSLSIPIAMPRRCPCPTWGSATAPLHAHICRLRITHRKPYHLTQTIAINYTQTNTHALTMSRLFQR